MDIKELSIGNWVRYDFPEIGKRNIQVNSIDEEDNHIGAGGVGASVWSDVSEFEPIPLTPEILEKNGLEYEDDENDAVIFLCCDMFWARLCVGDTFWQVGIHNEDRLDAVVCNVKHTHQLQNALRLADITIEFVV